MSTPVAGRPGAWLRRAGRLELADGGVVLWSVAEGRRGRRWRSLRLGADGAVAADLLLELEPGGSWARLELATGAGILVLHPEPDGRSAHGNVVTPGVMVHLAARWGSGHRLVVEGDPVAVVALAGANPAGPGPGLVVTADLRVIEVPDVVAPPVPTTDGLPGPSWPLEVGD